MNPTAARITYDIKDLYDYIDSLVDMSCMVYVNTNLLLSCSALLLLLVVVMVVAASHCAGVAHVARYRYNPELQAYNPFNKDWIKQRLLVQLKKMAGQRA
jgi:hypothetical protein